MKQPAHALVTVFVLALTLEHPSAVSLLREGGLHEKPLDTPKQSTGRQGNVSLSMEEPDFGEMEGMGNGQATGNGERVLEVGRITLGGRPSQSKDITFTSPFAK